MLIKVKKGKMDHFCLKYLHGHLVIICCCFYSFKTKKKYITYTLIIDLIYSLPGFPLTPLGYLPVTLVYILVNLSLN